MSNIQRARRIPNAHGQILIENWVEERATEHIDHRLQSDDGLQRTPSSTSSANIKKTSHTGLLTQNISAPLNNLTTYRVNYDEFGPFERKEQGARRKQLEHALTREVAAEFKARQRESEDNLRQERILNSNSEYRAQYRKEFQSKPPAATQVNLSRFHSTSY
jgi:hypothetical protein